jgi:hypothetical protein
MINASFIYFTLNTAIQGGNYEGYARLKVRNDNGYVKIRFFFLLGLAKSIAISLLRSIDAYG